ncbi:MAG: ribose-phosphate pyrophosphokinase [Acidaminococcus sp.]|nr:ribose-phosphate pyrophosphokinase [Acidaminococcus sp.]MDY4559777.1 ribose-phosphate pyrophosphokinase [Eubacteriales bacterium]MDY5345947.1 ribose-phosphate pyrophosphokinase [Eubacteriales bacterium]
MTPIFDNTLSSKKSAAPLAIIALPGAMELAKQVDQRLMKMFGESKIENNLSCDSFIIDSVFPRFTSGDGKAMILDTVRGKDLYIICDVGNHGIKYNFYGQEIPVTPDEHYADLKRVIAACNGKPYRITVIMPMLYGGRQHRRAGRESLDCASMLQELQSMGVRDIITFDAHDPRVQNAVPLMGFDNYFAYYQILKAMNRRYPDLDLHDNFMVVSPDEGAMTRNIYYASVLGVDLGMFFKRRDYTKVINGRNPIIAHEYIGGSVEGKNIFVADDIIATGDSVIKLAKELKEKGANKIFLSATFPLFTEGVEKFNKAHEEGLFEAVISTNLTYRIPELKDCDWFIESDMSKYIGYIIAACNFNESVGKLIDPIEKIKLLLKK